MYVHHIIMKTILTTIEKNVKFGENNDMEIKTLNVLNEIQIFMVLNYLLHKSNNIVIENKENILDMINDMIEHLYHEKSVIFINHKNAINESKFHF